MRGGRGPGEGKECEANKGFSLSTAYNVIKVLRGLGTSFEEIAALGCHLNEEPGRNVDAGTHCCLVCRKRSASARQGSLVHPGRLIALVRMAASRIGEVL